MNFLAYDRAADTVYAATDLGVYFMQDDNKVWTRLGDNLPNTATEDLKMSSGKLYVGTFGRGTYRIPLIRGLCPLQPAGADRSVGAVEPGHRHGPLGGRDDATQQLDHEALQVHAWRREPVRRAGRVKTQIASFVPGKITMAQRDALFASIDAIKAENPC